MATKTLATALTTLGLGLAFGAGCQRHEDATGSNVKSLDNVTAHAAGQTGVDNTCGPTLTSFDPAALSDLSASQVQKVAAMQQVVVVQAPDANNALKLAAVSGLTAAPASLLQVVFGLLNAKVVITADTATAVSLCSDVLNDVLAIPEEKELTGSTTQLTNCWLPAKGSDPLRLVMAPDAGKIRGNMLQLLAFTYTEYLVTKLSQPNPPAPFNQPIWTQAISGFNADNASLALTFLSDVKDTHTHDSLAALQTSNATAFGFLVYANALDSYYCSPATRTALQTQFYNTCALFEAHQAADLGDLPGPSLCSHK